MPGANIRMSSAHKTCPHGSQKREGSVTQASLCVLGPEDGQCVAEPESIKCQQIEEITGRLS